MGVVFHNPKLSPVRKTVEVDGRKCLVFLSEGDRQRKMGECREEVEANCRGGARGSCVLKAADSCRGTWWRSLLPLRHAPTHAEVEACEARALEACVNDAAVSCREHAATFCEAAYPKRLWLD